MPSLANTGLLLVPLGTAAAGLLCGWWLAAGRTRKLLRSRVSELEIRLHDAQARADEMRQRLPALRDEITSQVQDRLQSTLYDFFTDLRTSLDLGADFEEVRKLVSDGRQGGADQIEALRVELSGQVETLRSTLDGLRQEQTAAFESSSTASDLTRLTGDMGKRLENALDRLQELYSGQASDILSELDRQREALEQWRFDATVHTRSLPWESASEAEN